jgi:hypothetical protein
MAVNRSMIFQVKLKLKFSKPFLVVKKGEKLVGNSNQVVKTKQSPSKLTFCEFSVLFTTVGR